MLGVREGSMETAEDFGPGEANGKGGAELGKEMAAIMVPRVSLNAGAVAAEVWGDKHLLAVAEDPAMLVGITVGMLMGLPCRPLCPIGFGV